MDNYGRPLPTRGGGGCNNQCKQSETVSLDRVSQRSSISLVSSTGTVDSAQFSGSWQGQKRPSRGGMQSHKKRDTVDKTFSRNVLNTPTIFMAFAIFPLGQQLGLCLTIWCCHWHHIQWIFCLRAIHFPGLNEAVNYKSLI